MKIVILPSWYPKSPSDSSGVFFRDQALALSSAGYNISILTLSLRSLRTLFIHDGFSHKSFEDDQGIKTYRKQVWAFLPRIPYGEYFVLRMAAMRLFRQIVRQNGLPDIIHAHSLIYGGIIAAEIGKKYNIPVVLTEHSTGFAREVYKKWQLRLAKMAVRNVSYRIAVSEPFANLLEQKLNCKWNYLPNIVADRFNPKKSQKSESKKTKPVLLNLALLTPKKGQKTLLKAVLMLKKRGVKTELWLAGDGPIRLELENYTNELGLDNQVKFLGMINPNDVPELMAKTDLLVVSSEYETFGVVAAEALMMGKPVVATKCGGPESIIKHGDGLLVQPRDPLALADGLQKVLENLSNFDSNQISLHARERFGSQAIVTRLTEIYAEVLEEKT